MTLKSDFSELKHQVIRSFVSSDSHRDHLHSLKDLFREDINSVRKFEKITTIGQLLNILELRGLLSEDQVEPLKDIARKINSHELLSKVNKYEDSHIPRECGNYYIAEGENNRTWSSVPQTTCPSPSNISQRKKDRMIRTVVEEIGTSWRELGRRLHVRECDIEDIENNNRTMATMALRMMEKFDGKVNQQKWYYDLTDALDSINRRGIGRSLREIMMMNI